MLKMMIFVDNKFNCCYLSLASGSFDSRAASTDSRALIGDRGRDASTEVGLVSAIANCYVRGYEYDIFYINF